MAAAARAHSSLLLGAGAQLGPADGPIKRAIFGENSAKMYRYEIKKAAWRDDRFAAIKSDYERRGREPSNLRYGYVAPS